MPNIGSTIRAITLDDSSNSKHLPLPLTSVPTYLRERIALQFLQSALENSHFSSQIILTNQEAKQLKEIIDFDREIALKAKETAQIDLPIEPLKLAIQWIIISSIQARQKDELGILRGSRERGLEADLSQFYKQYIFDENSDESRALMRVPKPLLNQRPSIEYSKMRRPSVSNFERMWSFF